MRYLTISAVTLAVLATGLTAQRQKKSQEQLQASFDEMKTHKWYTGGGWTTDFAVAKETAKKTGKPIFAYFTRTYAP